MEMNKKIMFNSKDGTNLVGLLSSEEDISKPLCIMCHGLNTSKEEYGQYNKLVKILFDNGINSFRFDFRGHGESSGKDKDMTVLKEVEDLSAAFDLVKGLGYSNIYLMGSSFGGGVVSIFSSEKPSEIKGVILINPLVNYTKYLPGPNSEEGTNNYQRYKLAKEKGFVERVSQTTGKIFTMGYELFEEASKLDPIALLKNTKLPVYIVHGTKDIHVPVAAAYEVLEKIPYAKGLIIEDGIHGFHDNQEHFMKYALGCIDFINTIH